MLKIFLLSVLLTASLFAQYTERDTLLIKTTFLREFDRNIIHSYLDSNDSVKVIAALLSIAQSQDTLFVPEVIKADYSRYPEYITFTLGQLGTTEASVRFLTGKIYNSREKYKKANFDALGKLADSTVLKKICHDYLNGKGGEFDGISLAIANFGLRNIRLKEGKDFDVLKEEITRADFPDERKTLALYALSRLGAPERLKDELVKVIRDKAAGKTITLKQYALASLRKMKYFPEDFSLVKSILSNPEWIIRTEAAKVAVYYPYKLPGELDLYLRLLNDPNPNVSRQAAVSLADIKAEGSLSQYLKTITSELISLEEPGKFSFGELIYSYCRLFPSDGFQIIQSLYGKTKGEYLIRALAECKEPPESILKFVNIHPELAMDHSGAIEKAGLFIALQSKLPEELTLDSLLCELLKDRFAPLPAIIAEGIDSVHLLRNIDRIKDIIRTQIKRNLNNSEFSETLPLLAWLGSRTDKNFFFECLEMLKTSVIHSVSSYAQKELGENLTRDDGKSELFSSLIKHAFKYSKARIKTTRGDFIINFLPGYAPLSQASFCALASGGFFNGVKFHRVVPNFVIQTGDPLGTGWGGPGYEIVSELSPGEFSRSSVGMASSGKDTEGSQWFVMHSYFPHLNGRYTNFATVSSGMDVVDIIEQGDKVTGIELIKK